MADQKDLIGTEGVGTELARSGQATFDERDRSDIIRDKDETVGDSISAGPSGLDDLENNEPAEFVRGEIDVKTQMDRATRIARAEATGHHDLDDSPDMTPGGIEEVAAKTDQDLALRKGRQVH